MKDIYWYLILGAGALIVVATCLILLAKGKLVALRPYVIQLCKEAEKWAIDNELLVKAGEEKLAHAVEMFVKSKNLPNWAYILVKNSIVPFISMVADDIQDELKEYKQKLIEMEDGKRLW